MSPPPWNGITIAMADSATRRQINTTIRGLSVTGTLITGDWAGGPDIGYIEYDPYIEDMAITDENGDPMEPWLTDSGVKQIEAAAIKEATNGQ